RCHSHGLPVGVYTVNRTRPMRRLLRLGVHAIFTDRPDRLRDVLISAPSVSELAGAPLRVR
ncbi:MAG: glycerophosphodiester phosphodiesterase family protein, partial [Holophagae bacterium]